MLPEKLMLKLKQRKLEGNLRALKATGDLIDFSSNDYLGFTKTLNVKTSKTHGATGSRLITGHTDLHTIVEKQIAAFHNVPAALLFNSGYDANLGLIPAMTDRNDLILYDELVHASIRDGIQLSQAKSLKFKHNDIDHLQMLFEKHDLKGTGDIYIITESVFSMDGDVPDLKRLVELVQKQEHVHIILDEAHALGVIGTNGVGLAQELGLQDAILARVVTFGKALGSHGAAVLGSEDLKSYLLNFARSFIYTTALPEHSLHCIAAGYRTLQAGHAPVALLQNRIKLYVETASKLGIPTGNDSVSERFRESEFSKYIYLTAIQTVLIPGNENAKLAACKMQEGGYDIRAILSPTVPAGKERLRICLHAYNGPDDIVNMLNLLAKTLKA
jgi:8-amino-7-oxononanoate synthase